MIKHSQKLFKVGKEWDWVVTDEEDGAGWDPKGGCKNEQIRKALGQKSRLDSKTGREQPRWGG